MNFDGKLRVLYRRGPGNIAINFSPGYRGPRLPYGPFFFLSFLLLLLAILIPEAKFSSCGSERKELSTGSARRRLLILLRNEKKPLSVSGFESLTAADEGRRTVKRGALGLMVWPLLDSIYTGFLL